MAKSTFVTTSIAYINAEPHIGFLLELVAADVVARSARLSGDEVFFLTGTDEHGLKIQQAIVEAKEEPQVYADRLSEKYKQTARDFNISNDYFIRTTDPGHVRFIQTIWQRLEQAGVLKKRTYSGYYCTGCEAFKTDREIKNGHCVIHEQPVEKVDEENWFLSIKNKEKIKSWIGEAVFPVTRQQEAINVLENFDDVSVSRPNSKLSWGIPVPGDGSQTMYVWVDALFNYLSGIELSGRKVNEVWPADVQIVGKDILKFHAIVWPVLLTALDYELPKKLLVHGFVNVEGKKMSKSLGNVITPKELRDRYGVEATRYLLLRQLNFFEDSNFSWAEFDAIYNGELANGLGNLVARAIGLTEKAKLAAPLNYPKVELPVFPDFQFDLAAINELVKGADRKITENKLWVESHLKTDELLSVLKVIAEIAQRLAPYLPSTSKEIFSQLRALESKPLFPRLDAEATN